jgi:hypothetical protein
VVGDDVPSYFAAGGRKVVYVLVLEREGMEVSHSRFIINYSNQ